METGIDAIEIKRIEDIATKHKNFLTRIFTENEIAYSLSKRNRYMHLAARFAAKEAVLKALGTGLSSGIRWKDIEILNEQSGRPVVKLYDRALEIAENLKISALKVSITHTKTLAIAQVVAE